MMRIFGCLLLAMPLVASTVAAEPKQNPAELVKQLVSDDVRLRAEAKAKLIEMESGAVEALVRATCGEPSPDSDIVEAALSILTHWEEKSWTDPDCEAAIDRFIQLVRDPRNFAGEHPPLGPDARYPFAQAVRVLDISPAEAAAYLRDRGVRISVLSRGYHSSVQLPRDWVREPKDWLYIANLAREIPGTQYVNGKRHPISIDIDGPIERNTLVECLRFFRKSKSSPFSLEVSHAPITREAMLLLRSYQHLISFSGRQWDADITDDDWAKCISAWPEMISLILSPTAKSQTIAAASDLEHVISLQFNTATLTEDDLEPLRKHKTLKVLLTLNVETFQLTSYLSHDGRGKWQLEN